MRLTTVRSLVVVACAAVAAPNSPARAQIPEKFENLQFFPKDIPRDSLIQVMRGFSFALGVRCQHCHAGGDGISFEGVKFSSDEKAAKRNARFMLRMVDSLNANAFNALPERSNPPMHYVSPRVSVSDHPRTDAARDDRPEGHRLGRRPVPGVAPGRRLRAVRRQRVVDERVCAHAERAGQEG